MDMQFINHVIEEYMPVDVVFYTSEMSERELQAAERICKASTGDEIADIISDELVHSIMEQINEN